MRRIRRLLGLPAHEKWLLIKAWVLVFSVRLALWTLRFKLTERLLRRFNARPPQRLGRNRPPARRVARFVNIASRLVPGGGQCLTKALAAESLLVRRGYPTEVKLGVTRDEANKLIA
ncbi:MAG: lasso peptide biosynthesis B2 protein, partial [Planctomycetota bacterium]